MTNLFFDKNDNGKLGNEVLTTIRLENPEKFKVGNVFTLFQSKGIINFGQYQVIAHIIIKESQLNDWITQLDAAMDVEEFKNLMRECYPKKIGPNSKYSYVMMKRVKQVVTSKSLFK